MPAITLGYYDDSLGHGGTTRYLMELLGALERERFQTVFFAPTAREWHHDLRKLSVDIQTLSTPRMPLTDSGSAVSSDPSSPRRRHRLPKSLAWSLGTLGECRRLIRLFRRRPVDILHTNSTGTEVAPIAARLAGIPHVIGTLHVDPTYDLFGERTAFRYRLLERLSLRALHQTIAVSRATGEAWAVRTNLGAKYLRRLHVVHNGVDPARLEPVQNAAVLRERWQIPSDALVVGSLGRFDHAKGYPYLLDALAQVRRHDSRIHLLLAGRGEQESELREQASKIGIESALHFTGFVADVREPLACTDIYAQPSLCEALPIGILEAMAMSLPVVATRVGGVPEEIVEGETGCIVPARRTDALAKAILSLASDPALRQRMGEQGRRRVLQHFTNERMVTQTVAVYEQALRGTQSDGQGRLHPSAR
jgi:glycosyltransferase involved in cell wall biosynthesis